MNNYGIFDILGPVMIGPSSSHTAGAVRLANMVKRICTTKIDEVEFQLYGSFASTYKGHGTDKALVAGILGFDPSDERIIHAFDYAKEKGLKYSFTEAKLVKAHPNTVVFVIKNNGTETYRITGSSLGGGSVVITDINGLSLNYYGENPMIITKHEDYPGVISIISSLLYESEVNIGNMKVDRDKDNKTASMYVEIDNTLDKSVIDKIKNIKGMISAIMLEG